MCCWHFFHVGDLPVENHCDSGILKNFSPSISPIKKAHKQEVKFMKTKLGKHEVHRCCYTFSCKSNILFLLVLRKLVVFGFKNPRDHPDALSTISLVFQRIEVFSKARKYRFLIYLVFYVMHSNFIWVIL